MANRITRLFREIFGEGAPNARTSRVFREVFGEGAPKARVSRVLREVFGEGAPNARVSRVFREVFADNPVLVISPFIGGAMGDHDEAPYTADDDFDYEGDFAPSLVLVQGAPIILAEPDEPFEQEHFDYSDDAHGGAALFQPPALVLSAEVDEPDFASDDFDYDGDNSALIRRRFIHAHLWVVR